MLEEQNDQMDKTRSMHHREVTLADGRYMIFYTFDDVEESSEPKRAETVEGDNV